MNAKRPLLSTLNYSNPEDRYSVNDNLGYVINLSDYFLRAVKKIDIFFFREKYKKYGV